MSRNAIRHVVIIAVAMVCVLVVTIAGLALFPTILAQLQTLEDDTGPEFPVAVLVMPAVLSAVLVAFEVIRKRTGLLVR